MSKWSGSSYGGPKQFGWEEGGGKHKFPNGVVYEGNFNKGEFHGEGTLIYPNGGRYVAKWDRGKLIEGNYFFFDNLEYIDSNKSQQQTASGAASESGEAAQQQNHHKKKEEEGWSYCTHRDRQFYTEISRGTLRPEGITLLTNDIKGEKTIPAGSYDIGDGYYDPMKKCICEYDANFKRDLENDSEEQWIVEKCRYKPQPFEDDSQVDGQNDRIVQEMVKLNQNPELRAQRMAGLTKTVI